MESESSQALLHICSFIKPSLSKIIDLSYSSSLSLLIVLRAPCTIQIYRLPHYLHLYSIELPASDTPIRAIWIPPKGDILTLCSNGTLYLHSLGCSLPLTRLLLPGGGSTCFSYNFMDSLLIGGEDGAIRQYSLSSGLSMELEDEQDPSKKGFLNFVNSTRGVKGVRVLSLVWGNENKREFYGGYSDGNVRKFDKSGNVSLIVKLDAYVWRMEGVGDELICGCNDGKVRVLDTKFLNQVQELKTHEADIYAMEVSLAKEGAERSVFVSGSDSKIACLQKFEKGWRLVSFERGQSHDVNSLCLAEDTLISGGLTTDLCLYKLENGRFASRDGGKMEEDGEKAKKNKLRHITALPQEQVFYLGGDKILYRTSFRLEVWSSDYMKVEYRYLAEIRSNILAIKAAALSNCGSYCAYSNEEEIIIFAITSFGVEKINTYPAPHVSLLSFVSLDSLLFVDMDNKVATLDFLKTSGLEAEKWKVNLLKKGENCYFNQIDVLGEMVAVGGRFGNKIVVLDWAKKTLVMEIPLVLNSVGFTTFKLTSRELVVVYENNKIAVFDLKKKGVNAWTIKNFNKFPQNFLNNYNKFMGIIAGSKSKIILYTHFSFSIVDFASEVPSKMKKSPYNGKKPGNFDLMARDRPILYWGRNNEDDMVLIEGTWDELLRDMPGAINTKKFGN
jgi:hypothetical protein